MDLAMAEGFEFVAMARALLARPTTIGSRPKAARCGRRAHT